MALKPRDPSEIEQSQKELSEALSGSGVPGINVDVIKQLGKAREFEFPAGSGRWFDVPKVPYPIGTEINDLWIRLREHGKYPEGKGVSMIYRRLLDEIVKIAWEKLIVPRSKWDRFRKRIGLIRNPLLDMAEAEVADLIGFFLARRMASSVRFRFPATQEQQELQNQ